MDSESDSSIADTIEPGLVSSSTNSFVIYGGRVGWIAYTIWPENLAGMNFGGLALNSCELHLLDLEI